MSDQTLSKRYLIWGTVVNQPNIIEKLAGTIRRSPKLFQLVKMYYGPSGEDGKSIFYVEIISNEKNAQRLLKIYENYVETLRVWCREVKLENDL
ncbi:MAG: hypothetical protein ABDH32_02145 [Candidatus Caldarchaeales archaeon]